MSTNVASHLTGMAARQPSTVAVRYPDGRGGWGEITYAGLERDTVRIAKGLVSVGIGPGVRTVLMVPPGRDFFALVFAMFRCGAIPIVVDPGMGVANLATCLAESAPEAFVGIPKAHLARLVLGWSRWTIRTTVWVGTRISPSGFTLEGIRRRGERAQSSVDQAGGDDVAAILFTSGSTGTPKGAVYTHANFAAQVTLLRDLYGIEPGEVDLATFPLFALFDPALGMTTVVPDMDFTRPGSVTPQNILDPLRRFDVTNAFGSPALWRRVVADASDPADFASVRRVLSAGAPVPTRVLQSLRSLLPEGAQVFTPYGATEALPVASIGSDEILGETAARTADGAGVCVGRAVAPNDVRVIRIDDGPIATWSDDLCVPDGEVGEIVVKGPTVTQTYFARSDSTRAAKIADGDVVRHRMGDVGYFDDAGRLWYCGRKAHRVETPDGPVFPMQVERMLDGDGLQTALVGVGDRAAICYRGDKDALRVRAKHPAAARVSEYLHHPRPFPVDPRHNAKIRRELLAEWAAEQHR